MGVLVISLSGLKHLLFTHHVQDAGARHAGGDSAHLGLHMVSHVVRRAAQQDLPDRPQGITGQVGRLTLIAAVQEAKGAVDTVEWDEGVDRAINAHGTQFKGALASHQEPVG